MIHMLSHQLKRRNIQEELMDEGLTGSQRHIMKFILLRTLHTDVYQKEMCIRDRANPDGVYYKVFGKLSAGNTTSAEAAEELLKGIDECYSNY